MKRFLILAFLSILFISSCTFREKKKQEEEDLDRIVFAYKPYSEVTDSTANRKKELTALYKQAKGNVVLQDSIITIAQQFLFADFDNYYEAWKGTRWDFNGHTEEPKTGTIACGYLVTTILRDMGFKIPRIKWAQQASEPIILKMTKDIKRTHKQHIKDFQTSIKEWGEGLYVVGLDNHVGFIYNKDDKISFVHASAYRPQEGVMSEPLVGWNPLAHSQYRIVGKILDEEMIRNWLLDISYSE